MLLGVTFTSVDLFWKEEILDFVVRILCAAVAGFAIGFERKSRSKEAGVRTHTLVAIGSAILMIISKYAFADLVVDALGARGADSARIAAQVVSGVGFLGAGIIVYRRDVLKGLTTAAGIWTTAAIGMAFGAGMYIIGAVAFAVMLCTQLFLHLPIPAFKTRLFMVIHAKIRLDDPSALETVREIFQVKRFLKFRTLKEGDSAIAELEMHTHRDFEVETLYEIMMKYPFIISIEQTQEL